MNDISGSGATSTITQSVVNTTRCCASSLSMSEKTYERYTFPHDLSRVFRKSREELCNVRKFFLTMDKERVEEMSV